MARSVIEREAGRSTRRRDFVLLPEQDIGRKKIRCLIRRAAWAATRSYVAAYCAAHRVTGKLLWPSQILKAFAAHRFPPVRRANEDVPALEETSELPDFEKSDLNAEL